MKNKLLILLSLFFLIVPLTGCDENDSDGGNNPSKVNVSVSLVKGNESDISFNISDCARIVSGPGSYNAGGSASVVVEYYSKACTYHHVLDNNEKKEYDATASSNGKKLVSFNVTNLQDGVDRSIQVVFTGINGRVTENKVIFDGLRYVNGSNGIAEVLTYNQFAFPYKTLTNPYGTGTKYVPLASGVNNLYPHIGDVTPDTDITTIFADSSLNLNYVYLDLDKNGTFDFIPYKLTWRQGSFNTSTQLCEYNMSSTIEDISNFKVSEGVRYTCLAATLDAYNSSLSNIRDIAIENMLSSEIYISTTNIDTCMSAIEADKPVSETCMYALRLKSLYNVDNTNDAIVDKGGYYYGINSNDNLEGVRTENNGVSIVKKYIICSATLESLTSGVETCNQENTFWKDYEYLNTVIEDNQSSSKNETYKQLAVAKFIDELKTINVYENGVYKKTTYNVNSAYIKYDYNYFIGDIVPVEIDEYYIRYLSSGSGNPTYSGMPAILPGSSQISQAFTYTLKINEIDNPGNDATLSNVNTAIGTLTNIINEDPLNLLSKDNTTMIDSLRTLIFSSINANENQLSSLRGYRFEIEVNETKNANQVVVARELEVTLVEAKLTIPTELDFVKVGENIYCSASNEDCINENNYPLYKYIKPLTSEDIKTLKFQDIKVYINENDKQVIEFTILDENDNPVVIEYVDNVFSDSNTTLEYVSGTKLENLDIKTISSKVNSFIGDIVQTIVIFEDGKSETITTIGESLYDKDVDDKVGSIYEIFYNTNGVRKGYFYDMDGDEKADLFLASADKKIYALVKDDETGNIYYEYVYKFELELVNYRLIPATTDASKVDLIQLGDKICKVEDKDTCDNTYDELLTYIDKLISKDTINKLNFKNITKDEDVVTYEIYKNETDVVIITYKTTSKEFIMDAKKVIYYETENKNNILSDVNIDSITFNTKVGEVDVIQTLNLVRESEQVTGYSISTIDGGNNPVVEGVTTDEIVNVLKLFYDIDGNTITGSNSDSEWYNTTFENSFVINDEHIYEINEEAESKLKLVDENGNVFIIAVSSVIA